MANSRRRLSDVLHQDMGNWSSSDEETESLFLASQQFESAPDLPEREVDEILLAASQQFQQVEQAESEENDIPKSKRTRFGVPVTSLGVKQSRESGVPCKTQQQTSWACRVWGAWAKERNELPGVESEEAGHELLEDFVIMTVVSLQFWLPKFVLEVRRTDGEHYPPDSLYSICAGLQRNLKFNDRADVLIFTDPKFSCFRGTLDAEMKRLRSLGKYKKVKSDVIGVDHEGILWDKGLLGDSNPKVLIDTMVYYIGLYFAIRGGEHRKLCFKPSQIELVEPGNALPYMVYTEFVSKTNQGGLQHRKKEPKKVVHHANVHCPERCLVRLFKLYKCPVDRPDNAFYLRPLVKPKEGGVWYQKTAVGHNCLANVIPRLFKEAGISGRFTNHSLRATTATRLFDAGVDEQLIMSPTGHSSTTGVRSYKRATNQLREKTSSILNSRSALESDSKIVDLKPQQPTAEVQQTAATESKPQQPTAIGEKEKENSEPVQAAAISFSGATNFTVNFHF